MAPSYRESSRKMRPTYEELDYSPPATPKEDLYRPVRPQIPPFQWYLRRARTLFIPGLILFSLLYFFTHHSGPIFKPKHEPSLRYKNVDWSYFAYSQFATDGAYLCNSLMVFEALHRLGSKADRILLYPEQWDEPTFAKTNERDLQIMKVARDTYDVKLIPVEDKKLLLRFDEGGDHTWDSSINKFHAWNQTQYQKIIHLDSDIALQHHLDELFMLPSLPVAMTRAYWGLPPDKRLTSLFVLLEPDIREAARLFDAASPGKRKDGEYDMEILNAQYGDSAMILPHKRLVLLTGEFRTKQHAIYLGNEYEKWDAQRALREASIIHFSDWPLPKPWIMWPNNLLPEMLPKCDNSPGTSQESGCQDRDVWLGLYDGFRRRRKKICGLLSVPVIPNFLEPYRRWPGLVKNYSQSLLTKIFRRRNGLRNPKQWLHHNLPYQPDHCL